MIIHSWNVNGIRSCAEKGLWDWLQSSEGDVVCLQETKAHKSQLTEDFLSPIGWNSHWAEAEKKGYSGVATYSRTKPLNVRFLGAEEFDREGRVLISDFDKITVVNCYFPNSQEAGARLGYKLEFCQALSEELSRLSASGRPTLVCGDYNIAHKPIDLTNPKRNEGNPGYLPEERAWMEQFLNSGWTDTFRKLHPDKVEYSWWSYRFQSRSKNIGWRIDYNCVNVPLAEKVKNAWIQNQVTGSDHCPVSATLEI